MSPLNDSPATGSVLTGIVSGDLTPDKSCDCGADVQPMKYVIL